MHFFHFRHLVPFFPLEQTSSPDQGGSASAIIEQGRIHRSTIPSLIKMDILFGYWAIDGDRREPMAFPHRVSSVINTNSTYTAHYFDDDEDSDGDGVKDWFTSTGCSVI